MNETLKVLVVEDSRDDAELVLLELKRAGYAVASARVASGEGMKAALAGGTWDLVLSDYRMPGFSGIDALRILEATGLELPFVLVSGAIGEEEAVAAMKAGAHGFVAKHNLSRLGLVVERELKDAKARKARRQAEEELARSEERYRGVFEHSPTPLAVQDFSEVRRMIEGYRAAGVEDLRSFLEAHPEEVRRCAEAVRVKESNAARTRFFQAVDLAEGLWHFTDLYVEASWHYFREELVALASGRLTFEGEVPLRLPDGALKTIAVNLSVDPGCEATLDRVLVSFRDITERLQMEAALRDLDRLSAKGQMAAYIAHEINNPLAGIKNAFALLEPGIPADHPHRKYADLIRREIDRIAGIIRTMYHVYRPPSAEQGEVALLEVFQDIQNLLVPKCRAAGVQIHLDLPDPQLRVRFNGGLLRQVIFNLAQNAVEASEREGRVLLGARAGAQDSEITVRDFGCGIPPDWGDRVFRQGFTSKRDAGMSGLGIGLSTCKSLVESMGGTLAYTSGGPGEGCTFRVQLPHQPREPLP